MGSAILLPMQQDPMEEWRRLTALYGEMGDLEIHELTGQINDLTPNAQQILRDELKKRGISSEQSMPRSLGPNANQAAVRWYQETYTRADREADVSGETDSTD